MALRRSCYTLSASLAMAERFARIPASAIGCRELSATDWRILACLGLHADADGRAYPGMSRIAAMAGIQRKNVPRTLRRLVRLGMLGCDPGGPCGANVYMIFFDHSGASSPLRTEDVLNVEDGVSSTVSQSVLTGELKVSSPPRTKHTKEQTREHTRAGCALRGHVDQDGVNRFETFWHVYPSRGGHSNPKEPARKKFEAATRRGVNPTIIIRGAENYRTLIERGETNPRFVAQAVTWLSQERWNDYQEAPEPPRLAVGMI
jgi:hypothetical protein